MPVISNVVEIQIDDDGLVVRRDMEDGYQTVRSTMPALLLSSTGLDQPRLPSLKGSWPKKKPVETSPLPFRPSAASPGTCRTCREGSFHHRPGCLPTEAAKQLVGWLQEQKLI